MFFPRMTSTCVSMGVMACFVSVAITLAAVSTSAPVLAVPSPNTKNPNLSEPNAEFTPSFFNDPRSGPS